MIRAAIKADAAAIAEIWRPVLAESLATFNPVVKTAQDVAAMIAEKSTAGHGFFVAEEVGEILGFATYGQFRSGVGYAHTMEHTVILANKGQGRGIGRALLQAVEDHARDAGAHSMFAGVSAANQSGVAFHERLGYREVSRLSEVGFKFGQYLDLVLLQKFL